MAVVTNIYGDKTPEYVGCVMDTYERNGYNDSDWYAVCWDEEKQDVVHVNYDTTRCGGGGYAKIDITSENLLKVYRHYKASQKKWFDEVANPAQAKLPTKGDTVKVVRGRKVPKGTVGKIFWIGSSFNKYSYRVEERVGIEVGDARVFLPQEYVEVVGWESRLATGKVRKKKIQQLTVDSLPVHLRGYFDNDGRWAS